MNSRIEKIKKSIEKGWVGQDLETFLKLPRRAQELIWAIATDYEVGFYMHVAYCINEEDLKLTPIEIIFKIAFDFYSFEKDINIPKKEIGNPIKSSPPEIMIANTGILTQKEIIVDEKKYIVDFLFDGESGDFSETIGNTKIVIECDGHEFHHKTKKQVEYDNERQLALQTAGYEVIRFSGSQIYNNPLGCAENAYNFILSKISKL